ncbi:MAG: sporulation protein YqfD [Syntrophomonadaceae bacterium]
MAGRFSDQIGGFISLRLRGQHQEKIINLALVRGIYIWDIKRDGDYLYLKVRNSGYEAFKVIAEEHDFELEVLKRDGLPFYKKILKRRVGLLGGAALFIAALYLISSFVWFVDVSGNQKVEGARILASAARNGVYPGAGKWSFSRIEAEEAMLRELSELTYVECDIKGVRANIKVVEKILPDPHVTGPCDIVAERDGLVEEVLVLNGRANVQKGNVVVKGDVLISGIFVPTPPLEGLPPDPNAVTEPTLVRARGHIKARTWYEGYGEAKRIQEDTVLTGEKYLRLAVKTPWRVMTVIGKGDIPFLSYEQRERGWAGPGDWGLGWTEYREQKVETTQFSENEAVETARQTAMANLKAKMEGDVKIVDSRLEVLSSPSDPIVRIKVFVEGLEDIGMPQAVEAGEISR